MTTAAASPYIDNNGKMRVISHKERSTRISDMKNVETAVKSFSRAFKLLLTSLC